MNGATSVEFPDRSRRKRLIVRTLLATDTMMLVGATLAATWVRFGTLGEDVAIGSIGRFVSYWQVSLAVSLLWLVILAVDGMYDLERLTWGAGEFSRVMRAISLGVVIIILVPYVVKAPGLSRAWTLLSVAFAFVAVSVGRLCVRAWLHAERTRGHMHRRTLVVGNNAEAVSIIQALAKDPGQGLTPVGCLASSKSEELALDYCDGLVEALGHARDVKRVVDEHDVDTVIIAGSAFDHEVISRIVADLRGSDVSIHVSSGLFDILTSRVLVRDVAGIPLITVKAISLSAANLRTKRLFDVVMASSIAVLGMPFWLVLAAVIKLDSRGPVFFRQTRVGRGGVEFDMLKFRSMYLDADARRDNLAAVNEASGPLFKMKDDPRVTRTGKWMRKFSVDEFPQLLNVLRGEMSLVGPRPPLPRETVQYRESDWRRMEVPPGMTGLWQVSGRSSLSFDEMVRLDMYYIENWSVGFDLALIVRTIPAMVFARGAY